MLRSSELQEPLETIEEVAAVLRTVLEEAKRRMGQERIPTYTTTCLGLEEVGNNKGLILRDDNTVELSNITVPGMTVTEAIQAALTQVLGVPQPIPADAVARNLYVVQLDPVLSASRIPTLKLGKVDESEKYLAQAIARYEEALGDPNGPIWQRVSSEEVVDGTDGKTPQDAVREDAEYLRSLQGNILPLFIWTSNTTSADNVFEASQLLEGEVFHLIEMPQPPAPEVEEEGGAVRSSIREVTSS